MKAPRDRRRRSGSALAAASSARAADLPLKASPPAAWDWSGFYVGGHAGYGWGKDPFTDINDTFLAFQVWTFLASMPTDFSAGYTPEPIGKAKKSSSVEADLSFANIKGSSANTASLIFLGTLLTGTAALSGAFDLLGTDRVRLGYLVTPNVLVYGTGGLTWTRFAENSAQSFNVINTAPPGTASISDSASVPSWRFGWVAGLGAEARLPDTHWTARLEYLHYAFGSDGSVAATLGVFSSRTFGDLTANVVRAGPQLQIRSWWFGS